MTTKVLRLTTEQFLNQEHGLKLFKEAMHRRLKAEESSNVPDKIMIEYFKRKIVELTEQIEMCEKSVVAEQ